MPRPRFRRPGETAWSLALGGLAWAGIAVGIAALVVRRFAVDAQPWIVAASFARYLLLAAPAGLGLAVLRRRGPAAAVAVIVTITGLVTQIPIAGPVPADLTGPRLSVLQANLRVGSADPHALVAQVERHDVAVLMTEELTIPERQRLLAAGLGALLPYRLDAALPSGGGGLALWSRYPLSAEQNYPGYELGVLSARAVLPTGRAVTVFAVHLLPPYPYPPGEWVREIAALRTLLGATAGDVVVAGDFNATPDNAQFRALLGHGYADGPSPAAENRATYPADRPFPPLVAIDHVLTAGAAVVTALSTVALPGSDHRGLLASVGFAG